MEKYIQIFKALGDETRLKIIQLLFTGDHCVGGLAKQLGISNSAVSQQLSILKEANLVSSKKVGYYSHYSVQKEELSLVINEIKKWK
ncbi:metalloregulator ArsR/SmtB family transcription factor [Candidatus Izimaplasma bacterium]|nr:metalloregulator ArsR/SmtB family transcription factor [Candidatus Izimaplasma bacterium]